MIDINNSIEVILSKYKEFFQKLRNNTIYSSNKEITDESLEEFEESSNNNTEIIYKSIIETYKENNISFLNDDYIKSIVNKYHEVYSDNKNIDNSYLTNKYDYIFEDMNNDANYIKNYISNKNIEDNIIDINKSKKHDITDNNVITHSSMYISNKKFANNKISKIEVNRNIDFSLLEACSINKEVDDGVSNVNVNIENKDTPSRVIENSEFFEVIN